MVMENFGKESKEIVTDEQVLVELEIRLKKIHKDLGKADETESPEIIADNEDQDEAGEEKDLRQALGNELKQEEQEIVGAISWIKEHSDACASAGCRNKVSDLRRKADPASITCTLHMEDEDQILRDLAMGLSN